ncbi:MAG: DNA repair protein RecO [Myxococcota bacterium]|jgi:DNA repair protein RecO (recombination protein O)|nr:DNA repair protein RecO [Myxococcota bacterium]
MVGIEDEAIVLRAVDFGESDLIAHLLVPEIGRLTVIAKHARKSRKRFPGSLDIFNHIRVRVSRKRPGALGFLEQALLLDPFLPLREVPARFALASYLVELMDRMAPEGGPGPDMRRLFDFVHSALVSLGQGQPDLCMRLFLELRAFDALGLRPGLERCVRCGSELAPGPVGFHVADGGGICDAHGAEGLSGVLRVHLGTLRALDASLGSPMDQLPRLRLEGQALAEAREILFRFHRFHLGFELKSEGFLEESLGGLA